MTGAPTRIYLDHNATTPLRPAAREAVMAALDETGNASSIHCEGRAAHARMESARRAVAALVGADPRNVIFTSGGSEANVTALTPDISCAGTPRPASRLFVSAVEHASVLAGGRFAESDVTIVPVDADGVIDLDQLAALTVSENRAGGRPLVSVMAANNETGAIQPVAEVARIVADAGGYLHVDAVQAPGRMAVSPADWGADMVTVSSHKIGGPLGAGALVYANEDLRCAPLIAGGGQETRRRAGTENIAAIAGFGAAAEAVRSESGETARLRALRDWLEGELTHISGDTVVFGRDRLPNTISFAVPGVSAETALIACDLAGAAVSSGSACSSGKVAYSHVLTAMGVKRELAQGAIRISLGWTSTREDVERFAAIWRTLMNRLRPAAGRAA